MTGKDLQGATICYLFVTSPVCAFAAEMVPDKDGSIRAQMEVMELLPGSETTLTPAERRQSPDRRL
jgi:hypothetical protein